MRSDPRVGAAKPEKRTWQQMVAKYQNPSLQRSMWQVANTLIPYFVLLTLMYVSLSYSYWITLALALPAGGLLTRSFIIFHDCGHGSFFKSREINDYVGRAMSLFTLAPYGLWRREHAQHHATSGNLDKRGSGDIDTLTVAEYQALSPLKKLRYKIYRNPVVLFGLGVPSYFQLIQRTPWLHAVTPRESIPSVMGLNLAILLFYGPLCYVFGLEIGRAHV